MSSLTTNLSLPPRIRRISAVIRWLAVLAMMAILVVAVYSMSRGSWDWSVDLASAVQANARSGSAAGTNATFGVVWGVLESGVMLYALARLVRMMRLFERGEIFSLRAAAHLQVFSGAIVIFQVLDIVQPLITAATEALISQVHGAATLEFNGANFSILLLATLFLVLAQILKEGARLAEDNASIV